MVAVPSIGRAGQPHPQHSAPEADATRRLYEQYARQIYAYCLHQLRNKEEAEDATQSTFLNAFRGLRRGIDPEFESAWLYKIAHNVCLTRQRSSTRRRRVESPGDLGAMQDLLPAREVDSDDLIGLPEALHGMPDKQRRALLLREWQGLSYKEIADELDLSQAAVETLLFRARRSLATGLDKQAKSGDSSSVVAIIKSLLVTGGAKAAATAAATVAATSVVAATPAARHVVEDAVPFAAPAPSALVHHAHHAAAPRRAARSLSVRVVSSSASLVSASVPGAVAPPAPRPSRHSGKVVAAPTRLTLHHAPKADPSEARSSAQPAAPPVPTPAPAPLPTSMPADPAPAPAPTPPPPPAATPPAPTPAPAAATPAPPASPPGRDKAKGRDKDAQTQTQAPATTQAAANGESNKDHGRKTQDAVEVVSVQPAPTASTPTSPTSTTTTPASTTPTSAPAPTPDYGGNDHSGNDHGKKWAPPLPPPPPTTTTATTPTPPAATTSAPTASDPAPITPGLTSPSPQSGGGHDHGHGKKG